MKVAIISVVSILGLWILYYFAVRYDSQRIAGITLPYGSERIFRKKDRNYAIYKWHIPKKDFSKVTTLEGVSESPFHDFVWSDYEFFEFSDGPEKLLTKDDIADDSESIHYRTDFYDVELIRSKSESSIIIIGIYNN